jgi:hypothetical protein
LRGGRSEDETEQEKREAYVGAMLLVDGVDYLRLIFEMLGGK